MRVRALVLRWGPQQKWPPKRSRDPWQLPNGDGDAGDGGAGGTAGGGDGGDVMHAAAAKPGDIGGGEDVIITAGFGGGAAVRAAAATTDHTAAGVDVVASPGTTDGVVGALGPQLGGAGVMPDGAVEAIGTGVAEDVPIGGDDALLGVGGMLGVAAGVGNIAGVVDVAIPAGTGEGAAELEGGAVLVGVAMLQGAGVAILGAAVGIYPRYAVADAVVRSSIAGMWQITNVKCLTRRWQWPPNACNIGPNQVDLKDGPEVSGATTPVMLLARPV